MNFKGVQVAEAPERSITSPICHWGKSPPKGNKDTYSMSKSTEHTNNGGMFVRIRRMCFHKQQKWLTFLEVENLRKSTFREDLR